MTTKTKVRFAERPEGAATMSPEMPGAVNYYDWIGSQMIPHLGQNILDVGGGYGAHLEHIVRGPYRVMSVDLSQASVEFMRERFKDFPNFEAIKVDFGSQHDQDALIARRFDTIISLNVLEHIEDDLAALRDMYRILEKQQGTLFIQVPAHEWLYGSLDSLAGHYRRYTKKYLRGILTQAGFTIQRLYHFNSFGTLPWFINARILKPRDLEAKSVGAQVRLFDRYFVPVLRRVENVLHMPFGQSLMAVAKVG